MKRICLAVVAVLSVLTISGNAQAQDFSWGPKVGMNLTWMSNSGLSGKTGLMAGVFAEKFVGPNLAVSAEALYSRQGGKDSYKESGEDKVKTRIKTHYLNIPVMANYYFTERWAVKAGLQPGFNLADRAVVKQGDTKTKTNIGSSFRTVDLSLPVGISYDLGELIIEARYAFGLTKIAKEGDAHNKVFTLSAAIRF